MGETYETAGADPCPGNTGGEECGRGRPGVWDRTGVAEDGLRAERKYGCKLVSSR